MNGVLADPRPVEPPRADDRAELRATGRAAVIAVMLGCIVLAVVGLVQLLADAFGAASGWRPTYFYLACAIAILEAYLGRRWRKSLEGPDRWKFALLEVVVFLVLLKAGSYLGDSLVDVRADVSTWVQEPSRVLDGETVVALALALVCWFAYTQTLDDLERLEEPPELQSAADTPVPQVRLFVRFLWGGVVLLVVSGITWVGQSWSGVAGLLSRDSASHASPLGQLVNVLVYFCLGLVMLGQVRYVALRQDWKNQKIEVVGQERSQAQSRLRVRWWRYSLLFVALAALVALLLPTGYTVALLDVLRYALAGVLRALWAVAAGLFILLSLPIWLLARLFMGEAAGPPPGPRSGPMSPPAQPAPGEMPDWLGIVRAALFWIVVLGFTFYLVRGLLRDHPEIGRALASWRPFRWLRGLWQSLLAQLVGWRAVVRRRARPRTVKAGETREKGRGGLSGQRAGQSNRDQVVRYYLDVVRQAGRAGVARRPWQTPDEYGAVLREKLEEGGDRVQEMELLTEAFVEARYSRHPIEMSFVRRVRASWQEIKQVLSSWKKARSARRPG